MGRPDLAIAINGGITTIEAAREQLALVDGVMVGRAAYQNPYILAEVDRAFFNEAAQMPTREEVVERFLPYVERQLGRGVPLNAMTRHILGLFNGVAGGRAWRRHLSENAHRRDAGIEVIRGALAAVSRNGRWARASGDDGIREAVRA